MSSPRRPAGTVATTPGAGAAGGVGFAAAAVLGAKLRPGCHLVLDLVGFADAARRRRSRVTGEGALDEQTLQGKARPASRPRPEPRIVPTVAGRGPVLVGRAEPAAAPDSTASTPWSTRRNTRTSHSLSAGRLLRADRGPSAERWSRAGRMTVDLLFRARRAIVGDGETSAAVGVADGRIARSSPRSSADRGRRA